MVRHLYKNIITSTRLLSILTIISFLLLTCGNIVSWNTPTIGHEASIYAPTPIIFWIALIFGLIVSFILIVCDIFGKPLPQHLQVIKWILLGLCVVSLTCLLVIRGYYGYNINGDTGTHIGNVLSALSIGQITGIYPNLYIHTIFLTELSSLGILYLTKITPPLFVILFIVGIYLLAKEIFPKKEIAMLSAFVACALPFGSVSSYTGSLPLPCYLPFTLTLLLFTPFLFYCIYRIVNSNQHTIAYSILIFILILSAMFYHILACAVLLLFIVILSIWVILMRKYYQNIKTILLSLGSIIGSIIVVGIMGAGWLNYLDRVLSAIQSKLLELLEPEVTSASSVYSSELSASVDLATNMDIIGVLNVMIRQLGSTGLMVLLILSAIPIIYSGIKKRHEYVNVVPLYILTIPLAGLALLTMVSSMPYQPGRMVMFITVIGILVSGPIFYHLLQVILKHQSNIYKGLSLFVLLGIFVPVFISGIYMYYPSYEVGSPSLSNSQVTVAGIEFYFENGNQKIPYLGLGYQPTIKRYSDFLYGTPIYSIKEGTIVHHFGYDTHSTLIESVKSPSYLLLDSVSIAYQQSYDIWQKYRHYWFPEEYVHVEYDSSVIKVMNNHDMRWYLIH